MLRPEDKPFVAQQIRQSAIWYKQGFLTFDELIRNIWFIRFWKFGWPIRDNTL